MQYQKNADHYLLLVEKDELIIEQIKQLVIKEQIGSGQISMIGSVTNVIFGYVPSNSNEYVWKTFDEQYELVSGNGTIAWDSETNEPIIHIHALIGNDNFQTFAGHLKDATVAIMAEIFISNVEKQKVLKKLNSKVGLKTWNLKEKN